MRRILLSIVLSLAFFLQAALGFCEPPPGTGIESRPPATTPLYLALPRYGQDPYEVIMVNGPFNAAHQDAQELKKEISQKTEASSEDKACWSLTLAGIESTRDKNYQAARRHLIKAVDSGCDEPLAAFYLGVLEEKLGKLTDSMRAIFKAQEQFTRHRTDHRYVVYVESYLGRSFFRYGKYKEASYHLTRVLDAYPEDLPHHFFLALSLYKQDSEGQAMVHLKKVAQLAKQTPQSNQLAIQAYTYLAQMAALNGEFSASLVYASEGLNLDPKNVRLNQLAQRSAKRLKDREKQDKMGRMDQPF